MLTCKVRLNEVDYLEGWNACKYFTNCGNNWSQNLLTIDRAPIIKCPTDFHPFKTYILLPWVHLFWPHLQLLVLAWKRSLSDWFLLCALSANQPTADYFRLPNKRTLIELGKKKRTKFTLFSWLDLLFLLEIRLWSDCFFTLAALKQ